ncbi:Hpt domain-containing protein, partial [Rhodanobacter thiooxydans]|uniref:Hpt domain-containing protein n=1 Tax=Rhodanobacter thiooxydans TaxID=416169 RepID=UPI000260D1F8
MDAELDNELRQDFLVEAGELLQRLDEQLVGLEAAPGDGELLNAVFRAFHTVKGGAGFLALEPMVLLCHHAEDLLNEARNGKLVLGAVQMDALLQALDLLNGMMVAVGAAAPLQTPPPALLAALLPQARPVAAAAPAPPVVAASSSIDDSEFEALLE